METETPPVEIPWHKLEREVLHAVIDDFILRDGTDYGWIEKSLDQKRDDVLMQLNERRARIMYDPGSESVTVVVRP